MYGFVRIISVVRYMKTVYLMTKTIHHVSLDKKLKDQSGALHSPFFAILHDKRNIIPFKRVLGSMRIVAFSINSHEQTQ